MGASRAFVRSLAELFLPLLPGFGSISGLPFLWPYGSEILCHSGSFYRSETFDLDFQILRQQLAQEDSTIVRGHGAYVHLGLEKDARRRSQRVPRCPSASLLLDNAELLPAPLLHINQAKLPTFASDSQEHRIAKTAE